jgi:RHS repeat-associated protein
MLMPNRYGSDVPPSEDYEFGFNGMMKDNEVNGNNNSYTSMFRQYDPRIGRWLSIDPLFRNFPWQSPYVAFDNNPIYYKDPLGAASEESSTANNNPKKKETRVKNKFKRKYDRWQSKNKDLVAKFGKNKHGLYNEFKKSKNIFGKQRGNTNWFLKMEKITQVSSATGWEMDFSLHGKEYKGSTRGNGSSDETIDVELNTGTVNVAFNMAGMKDRMQVLNAETGETIFDTRNLKNADSDGKVAGNRGSGQDISFDLGTKSNGDKNTKLRVIMNNSTTYGNTVFSYTLRVMQDGSKSSLLDQDDSVPPHKKKDVK